MIKIIRRAINTIKNLNHSTLLKAVLIELYDSRVQTILVSRSIVIAQVIMCVLSLQECYWSVLYDRVIDAMQSPLLAAPSTSLDPFQLFDFSTCHQVIGEVRCSYVLALCHAVWVHASIGQLSTITL